MAAVAAAAPGVADPWPALSEHDYFEELPVVLSVSRLAQPLAEAPGAVTVIDREMIRLSGARHPIDLLRLVPGFQVAQTSNVPPVAVYHGLGESYPRHMQVLVDGRSQYSPFFAGGVNWDLIPVSLDDIDRIEVVRGSNSAAYGSNAFLGIVNIVTRHAAEALGASGELRSGTQGVNDKRIRLGAGSGDLAMRVTALERGDDGLDLWNDRKRQALIDYRADWRLGLRDELQFQIGRMSTTTQVGAGSAGDPLRDRRQSQQFIQFGWRRTLGDSEDLALRYYRTQERAEDAYTLRFYDAYAANIAAMLALLGIPNYTVPLDYGFSSVRNNIEAVHTLRPWQDTRLVWGGELRTDAVTGALYYGRSDPVALTLARVFGNLEWRPAPAWIANLGATWEHDSNSKTTFAPRLALNWHAALGQTLRAGIARAYRTPSLFEQRGNWAFASDGGVVIDRMYWVAGHPRPESILSREAGWIGEFRPLRLTADVRAFAENVADRTLAIPLMLQAPNCEAASAALGYCGQANDVFNVQEARIRGLEYQLRWQPIEATRVILNQAFIRIAADTRLPAANVVPSYQPAKDTTQTANSAPTHATTLMLMQRLPGGFELSAIYSSVGAMKWSTNTYARAWRRLDWRLGYPFRAGPTRGELAFTVQNDGTPHAEHSASEIVSRRGFVTLRLDY